MWNTHIVTLVQSLPPHEDGVQPFYMNSSLSLSLFVCLCVSVCVCVCLCARVCVQEESEQQNALRTLLMAPDGAYYSIRDISAVKIT